MLRNKFLYEKKALQSYADCYKGGSLAELLAFIYLYVPIVIFLCTWIRPFFAIIPLALLFLFFYALIRGLSISLEKSFLNSISYIFSCLLVFSLAYLWGRASGLDGHAGQVSDFYKHNAILRSLIQQQWPVRFDLGEQGKGILCYYFGYYLVPAIAGKIRSFNAATTIMLALSALGVTLTATLLYEYGKCKKAFLLLLIFANIFLFTTFIQPLKEIYAHIFPNDSLINDIFWISKGIRIQYRSFICALQWIAPQFVPSLLASALLWKKRGKYHFYPFIAMPLILYSTFAFVGIAALMLVSFLLDFKNAKEAAIKLIRVRDIIQILYTGGGIMFIPILFIACNVLQPKPTEAHMQLQLLFYNGKTLCFILFQLSWMLWLIPLRKAISNNTLLFASSIVLFILPLFHYGFWNDLCMNVSIPALCIFDFSITEKSLSLLAKKRLQKMLLLEALLFTAALADFVTIKDSVDSYQRKTKEGHSGRMYAETEHYTDELIRSTVMKYQYIAWEPNKISDILLKKH